MNLSPLVETLNEFDEFALSDTPLAADLEREQFLALSHAVHVRLDICGNTAASWRVKKRSGSRSFSIGDELGQPFTLIDHQREVLRLAFAFDQDGRLPWDTILYSCIKKSSKTTLNGALTLAWGFTQEAPNEILILANDLAQRVGRPARRRA
jgi:hypothetical protein